MEQFNLKQSNPFQDQNRPQAEPQIQFTNSQAPASDYQNVPPLKNDNHSSSNSPMHTFLYLVSFFALSFLATGVGSIIYQLINKNFTDPLLKYDYSSYFSSYIIKYGVASMIIAIPVYYGVMYYITKLMYEGRIAENSRIRGWLTYIILFLTSAAVIGDLITLIYKLLGGDIASRFILKTLTVFAICATIFAYYFWEMRKKQVAGTQYLGNKIFFISTISASILILLLAFTMIDGPKTTRNKKADEQTVSSLSSAKNAVENYYRENAKLPEAISDLGEDDYYYKQIQEGKVEYEKVDYSNYKLCAAFLRDNTKDTSERTYLMYSDAKDEWKHVSGKQCFDRNVEKIKPYVKPASNLNAPTSNIPGTSATTSASQDQFSGDAKKTSIKTIISTATSTNTMMTLCKERKQSISSGIGGDRICAQSTYMWPRIMGCGSAQADTFWVVTNGDKTNWEATLRCTNVPECSGSTNLKCTATGCVFSESCK